jgi:hypothetical protein
MQVHDCMIILFFQYTYFILNHLKSEETDIESLVRILKIEMRKIIIL